MCAIRYPLVWYSSCTFFRRFSTLADSGMGQTQSANFTQSLAWDLKPWKLARIWVTLSPQCKVDTSIPATIQASDRTNVGTPFLDTVSTPSISEPLNSSEGMFSSEIWKTFRLRSNSSTISASYSLVNIIMLCIPSIEGVIAYRQVSFLMSEGDAFAGKQVSPQASPDRRFISTRASCAD
ncbi:hypothetical protein ATCV1_z234R [Acanthocystis turfacea chlorella virus 1]|uniref:Uncharacterized protein z234R n=1 Tax=Chlorovirus heliozoae TaxID=322019 RepID=A7K8J4_9PHYC|nr:hypothetical protein ATCV1_z234R [Acanthocystis turfacea chlorella virus 1]ABT16368.1 hypothetical protein ATCV1_z234R [Acanthocystis turfacea chlorella virus 1]